MSARIPAWKRLGLKLNNAAQSGDAASPLSAHGDSRHTAHSHRGAHSGGVESRASSGPTENGTSTGLGKRKHHDDSAEKDGQTVKKTRTAAHQDVDSGAAGATALESAKPENEPPVNVTAAPEANTTQKPKGDPNYRKKKTKEPKWKKPKEKIQVVAHDDTSTQASSVPSIETAYQPSPAVATPLPSKKILRNASLELSPSRNTDRRKSVAFTPDTKTVDGTSAHNLFKQWAADQKAAQDGFTEDQVSQFTPPPKVHPANDISPSKEQPVPKEVKKSKKKQKLVQAPVEDVPPADLKPKEEAKPAKPKKAPQPQAKKKDPSVYLSYLSQYYNDNANWKFNKAKQNDVLDNALNIFRIPDDYMDALIAYVKGLKGAAIIERMKERCETTLKELDEEDKKGSKSADIDDQKKASQSADIDDHKKAKEEAKKAMVRKERKRRQTDADIEGLAEASDPDEFIRSLKRRRAENLRTALGVAIPIAPLPAPKPAVDTSTAPARNSRKRKSRTEVSSDESSSSSSESSSSEDSSSEESSSDDSDDESDSDDSADSDSSSDTASGDSDSGSGASAASAKDEDSSGSDGDTEESDSDDSSDSD